jgi:hypothetical protein
MKKDLYYKILAFGITYFVEIAVFAFKTAWVISKKDIEDSGYLS